MMKISEFVRACDMALVTRMLDAYEVTEFEIAFLDMPCYRMTKEIAEYHDSLLEMQTKQRDCLLKEGIDADLQCGADSYVFEIGLAKRRSHETAKFICRNFKQSLNEIAASIAKGTFVYTPQWQCDLTVKFQAFKQNVSFTEPVQKRVDIAKTVFKEIERSYIACRVNYTPDVDINGDEIIDHDDNKVYVYVDTEKTHADMGDASTKGIVAVDGTFEGKNYKAALGKFKRAISKASDKGIIPAKLADCVLGYDADCCDPDVDYKDAGGLYDLGYQDNDNGTFYFWISVGLDDFVNFPADAEYSDTANDAVDTPTEPITVSTPTVEDSTPTEQSVDAAHYERKEYERKGEKTMKNNLDARAALPSADCPANFDKATFDTVQQLAFEREFFDADSLSKKQQAIYENAVSKVYTYKDKTPFWLDAYIIGSYTAKAVIKHCKNIRSVRAGYVKKDGENGKFYYKPEDFFTIVKGLWFEPFWHEFDRKCERNPIGFWIQIPDDPVDFKAQAISEIRKLIGDCERAYFFQNLFWFAPRKHVNGVNIYVEDVEKIRAEIDDVLDNDELFDQSDYKHYTGILNRAMRAAADTAQMIEEITDDDSDRREKIGDAFYNGDIVYTPQYRCCLVVDCDYDAPDYVDDYDSVEEVNTPTAQPTVDATNEEVNTVDAPDAHSEHVDNSNAAIDFTNVDSVKTMRFDCGLGLVNENENIYFGNNKIVIQRRDVDGYYNTPDDTRLVIFERLENWIMDGMHVDPVSCREPLQVIERLASSCGKTVYFFRVPSAWDKRGEICFDNEIDAYRFVNEVIRVIKGIKQSIIDLNKNRSVDKQVCGVDGKYAVGVNVVKFMLARAYKYGNIDAQNAIIAAEIAKNPSTVDAAPDANINSEHSDTANDTPSTVDTVNDTVERVDAANDVVDAQNAVASSEPPTVEEGNTNDAPPFVYEMEHRAAANEEVNIVDGGDTTVASALSVDAADTTTNEPDNPVEKQSPTEKRAAVTAAIISDTVITPPTEMPTVDATNEQSTVDANEQPAPTSTGNAITEYYNKNNPATIAASTYEIRVQAVFDPTDFYKSFNFIFTVKEGDKIIRIDEKDACRRVFEGKAHFVDVFSSQHYCHVYIVQYDNYRTRVIPTLDDSYTRRGVLHKIFERAKKNNISIARVYDGSEMMGIIRPCCSYFDGEEWHQLSLRTVIPAQSLYPAEAMYQRYATPARFMQGYVDRELAAGAPCMYFDFNNDSSTVDSTNKEVNTVDAAPDANINSEHSDTANDTPPTVDAANDTVERVDAANDVVDARNAVASSEPVTVDDANDDSEHVEIKKEDPTPYPSGLTWCKLVSSADKWGLIDRIKHRFGIDYDNIGEFVGEYAIPLASNPFNTPARLVKRNGERWEYGYVMRDFFNATERVITDILMHQREMQKRKNNGTPPTVDAANDTPNETIAVDAPDANTEHVDTANDTPSIGETANDTPTETPAVDANEQSSTVEHPTVNISASEGIDADGIAKIIKGFSNTKAYRILAARYNGKLYFYKVIKNTDKRSRALTRLELIKNSEDAYNAVKKGKARFIDHFAELPWINGHHDKILFVVNDKYCDLYVVHQEMLSKKEFQKKIKRIQKEGGELFAGTLDAFEIARRDDDVFMQTPALSAYQTLGVNVDIIDRLVAEKKALKENEEKELAAKAEAEKAAQAEAKEIARLTTPYRSRYNVDIAIVNSRVVIINPDGTVNFNLLCAQLEESQFKWDLFCGSKSPSYQDIVREETIYSEELKSVACNLQAMADEHGNAVFALWVFSRVSAAVNNGLNARPYTADIKAVRRAYVKNEFVYVANPLRIDKEELINNRRLVATHIQDYRAVSLDEVYPFIDETMRAFINDNAIEQSYEQLKNPSPVVDAVNDTTTEPVTVQMPHINFYAVPIMFNPTIAPTKQAETIKAAVLSDKVITSPSVAITVDAADNAVASSEPVTVDATNEQSTVDANINSEHSNTANNAPSTVDTANDTVERVDAANDVVDDQSCDTADVVKLLNAYEASVFKFRFWMNVNGNNMALVISKAYDTLNDEYHQAMAALHARGITPSTSDAFVKARDVAEKTADIIYKKSKKTLDRLDDILKDVLDGAFVYVPQRQCDLTVYDVPNEYIAEPRVDVVIDKFEDDDPDDDTFFDVTPINEPDDDDELVDEATAPIVYTKEVVEMFTPTLQLLLPAPKIATLFLPVPAVNINFDSADACDNTPNKIDTAATVNALKTQAAEARIALELADFKARLDRITANFNIGIAALDECQTFAPRSHKGAIVKPKRKRLTGRRRKKTNAEQLKSLATPLIKQIAAISAEFQNDNAAPKTLNGSNNTPSTVETIDDAAKHVDASNGAAGFKSVLAFDSVLQSIKFGLIAALAVLAHFNPSPAVTDTALALASVFTVELVIKFCWLFAACSKAEERKGGDVGEIAPPEVKRLNRQPYNPLARAQARKSAWAIRERQAAPIKS